MGTLYENVSIESLAKVLSKQRNVDLYYRGPVYDVTGRAKKGPAAGNGWRIDGEDIYIDGSLIVTKLDVEDDSFNLMIMDSWEWPVTVGGTDEDNYVFELVKAGGAPSVPVANVPFEELSPELAQELKAMKPKRAGTKGGKEAKAPAAAAPVAATPQKEEVKALAMPQPSQPAPKPTTPAAPTVKAEPAFDADYIALFNRLQAERAAAIERAADAQVLAKQALDDAMAQILNLTDPSQFAAVQQALADAQQREADAQAATEAATKAAHVAQVAADARAELDAARQKANVEQALAAFRESLTTLLKTHFIEVRQMIADTGYELIAPDSGERWQMDEPPPPPMGGAGGDEEQDDSAGGDTDGADDGDSMDEDEYADHMDADVEEEPGDEPSNEPGDDVEGPGDDEFKPDSLGELADGTNDDSAAADGSLSEEAGSEMSFAQQLAQFEAEIQGMQADGEGDAADQAMSADGAGNGGALDVDAMNAALNAVLASAPTLDAGQVATYDGKTNDWTVETVPALATPSRKRK